MKFTPPGHSGTAGGTQNDHAQTAANFGRDGAKMEVCPSGDCTNGQFMRLTMSSIKEADVNGSVVQSVETFNKTTSDWSEMVTSLINGVNVSSTSYVTTLTVGTDAEVSFNLTASIFASNTTVAYGNQTITVPVGGLKFTLDLSTWPFASVDNTLTVAVKMESKGKGGKNGKPAKNGNSTHKAIERVYSGIRRTLSRLFRADMDDPDFANPYSSASWESVLLVWPRAPQADRLRVGRGGGGGYGEGILLPPTLQSQAGDAVRLDSSGERPFGGGICRQLAAMYTDVGMTTVERVRWHCGCMTLLYLLTSFAWFSWPVYMVPAVGMFTGIVGLLSCLRPHERRFLSYVLTFLALNFAQMALLCWVLFVTVTAQLAAACGDDGCIGVEAKTVLLLVLVMGMAGLHWRVANLTRHYIREFRMIEQLEIQGRRPRPSVSVAASSTMATEIHSSYSASGASASAGSIAVEVDAPPSATSSAAYHQVTRL
ncbi:hypothetical protein BBJ28_00010665 [Nothophytophthora sp. Chile5]|nr:hypothetical protein BBJ28_00010665 [Nothophytophthora sp. Chile5]